VAANVEMERISKEWVSLVPVLNLVKILKNNTNIGARFVVSMTIITKIRYCVLSFDTG
jgi:hypothetical protein